MPVKVLAQKFQRAFPMRWDVRRDFRLYDQRRRDLGPYYIEWNAGNDALGECWEGRPFDRAGVLQTQRGAYDPIDIFQFGLQCHSFWVRTGNAQARQDFLAQADWAVRAQSASNGAQGVYATPGSAMAQGQAISLLLRAYQETGERRYLDRAISASTSYFHGIDDGGVTWHGDDGMVVFEEAAALPASHTLNGWIYALWGLFELALLVDDSRAESLCRRSLATLRTFLPHYDGAAWSYRHLLAARNGFRRYATLKYHSFHIAQLHVLTSMTGDSAFSTMATRWQALIDSHRSRRLVLINALAGLALRVTMPGDGILDGSRSIV